MRTSGADSVGARVASAAGRLRARIDWVTDPWTDLALTLPVFLGYHLGVVFLPVLNAADFVTWRLVSLAHHSLLGYAGLTLALGAILVGGLVSLGWRKRLNARRFMWVIVEGAVYAALMKWAASVVVGSLRLSASAGHGFFAGLVMSLGAGFYEELAFRVVLFGFGLKVLHRFVSTKPSVAVGWGVFSAVVFSAWHYFGALGDPFSLHSFVFRCVAGLAFVLVYRYRGFAPVVWMHALYDIWVLAL